MGVGVVRLNGVGQQANDVRFRHRAVNVGNDDQVRRVPNVQEALRVALPAVRPPAGVGVLEAEDVPPGVNDLLVPEAVEDVLGGLLGV